MGQLIHLRSLSTQERCKPNLQGGPRAEASSPVERWLCPRAAWGPVWQSGVLTSVLLPGGQDVSSGGQDLCFLDTSRV